LGISYAAILLDTRNETCGVDPKHMIIRNEHALRMKQQQTTASVRSEKKGEFVPNTASVLPG